MSNRLKASEKHIASFYLVKHNSHNTQRKYNEL